jgi:hypothetical protein
MRESACYRILLPEQNGQALQVCRLLPSCLRIPEQPLGFTATAVAARSVLSVSGNRPIIKGSQGVKSASELHRRVDYRRPWLFDQGVMRAAYYTLRKAASTTALPGPIERDTALFRHRIRQPNRPIRMIRPCRQARGGCG